MIHEFERWQREVRAIVEAPDHTSALQRVLHRCNHLVQLPEPRDVQVGTSWIVKRAIVLDDLVWHCITIAQPALALGKQGEAPPLVATPRYFVMMTRNALAVQKVEAVALARVTAKPSNLPELPEWVLKMDFTRCEHAVMAHYLAQLDEHERSKVRRVLARQLDESLATPERDAMQDRIAHNLFGDDATPVSLQRARETLRELASNLLGTSPRNPWVVRFHELAHEPEVEPTEHPDTSGLPAPWRWRKNEGGRWVAECSDAAVAWDGAAGEVIGYGAAAGIQASDPVARAVAKRGRFLDSLDGLGSIKLDIESTTFGYHGDGEIRFGFLVSTHSDALRPHQLDRLRRYATEMSSNPQRHLILSVHDEIMVEMPEHDTTRAAQILRDVMRHYPKLEPFIMSRLTRQTCTCRDLPAGSPHHDSCPSKRFPTSALPIGIAMHPDPAVPRDELRWHVEKQRGEVMRIDGMPIVLRDGQTRAIQTWRDVLVAIRTARRDGKPCVEIDPPDYLLLDASLHARCDELCARQHGTDLHVDACPLRLVVKTNETARLAALLQEEASEARAEARHDHNREQYQRAAREAEAQRVQARLDGKAIVTAMQPYGVVCSCGPDDQCCEACRGVASPATRRVQLNHEGLDRLVPIIGQRGHLTLAVDRVDDVVRYINETRPDLLAKRATDRHVELRHRGATCSSCHKPIDTTRERYVADGSLQRRYHERCAPVTEPATSIDHVPYDPNAPLVLDREAFRGPDPSPPGTPETIGEFATWNGTKPIG